uniref:Uncharacterized protein n=1 Tax=Caenorhabditis japonica TaxID=281687 RepID=A0A8R1EH53_CAEJA
HHIRHKHRRRSLNSEESDATKTQRNKQIMLTKPYWPWP